MKDEKCWLFALLQMIAVGALSQDIEVKKFGPNEKDQTAALSLRKDVNGNACGLVKVQTEIFTQKQITANYEKNNFYYAYNGIGNGHNLLMH